MAMMAKTTAISKRVNAREKQEFLVIDLVGYERIILGSRQSESGKRKAKIA
jgi:hypothetical protein